MYNQSLIRILQGVYSDYDWLPWKFVTCSPMYFKKIENRRKFLEWAGKELGIKEIKDWENVTKEVFSRKKRCLYAKDIINLGGKRILSVNSLPQLLQEIYPEERNFPENFKCVSVKNVNKKSLTSVDWDPNGWWISEKYDGKKLRWTGSTFLDRKGEEVFVPLEISGNFPNTALDVELWYK